MERNEWLLKEQNRYCDIIDNLQRHYNSMDEKMNSIHKEIERLNREMEILNNEMTNTRNRIVNSEKRVCRINKALRNPNDPSIYDPRDFNGDRSNV